MSLPTLVILLGPRGSGKTTVGTRLANVCGVEFLDLDALIAHHAGRPIAEIFAAEGESGFRERESTGLFDALGSHAGVLATGGGVVVREANRKLLSACDVPRVFLTADPAELWRRIEADPATARPALTALAGEDEVRQLLEDRLLLYREIATHELDVTTMSVDETVDRLVGLLDIEPQRA